MPYNKKINFSEYCSKFNRLLKNGLHKKNLLKKFICLPVCENSWEALHGENTLTIMRAGVTGSAHVHTITKHPRWIYLVVHYLTVYLPMQWTWVWSLVWEDPTCCGATKPVHHSYWACALEPRRCNYWARTPRAHARQEKPLQWEAQQRPNTAINKLILKYKHFRHIDHFHHR